ncbi:hypothetical protein [Flavobacterium mekongense]|uniref:hypothetical protein n=1 Tax=Flavobacterium mekongense TaxID=3379707 RepID=UPI00399A97CF
MKQIIKKYILIEIAVRILAVFIPTILLSIFPDLLTFGSSGNGQTIYGVGYLQTGLEYFFNICVALFLIFDMKKISMLSISILILTLFSSVLGIIIFLICAFEKTKILQYEKQTY